MSRKILITGGCSAKALKLLKAFSNYTILFADYGAVPLLQNAAFQFATLGTMQPSAIAHNLLTKCLDHQVDIVLPLHTFEVEAVAKSILLFKEFEISVLLPEALLLDDFLQPQLPATNAFVVLEEGQLLYPMQEQRDFNHLSGVFYTDAAGTPIKLFTIV